MNQISILGIFVADLCFFSNDIPIRGQTILGTKHTIGPGGKGSNQAVAAARSGGNVNFITKIGEDAYGEMALSLYKESGVNIDSIIIDSNLSTGVAGIFIDETTGDNIINVVPGAAGKLEPKDIDKYSKNFKNSKIFLTQLETPIETTLYGLQKAKQFECLTILNPAPATELPDDIFQNIDFFTPNETEAGFYLNENLTTDKDIEAAGKEFLNKGVKNIIITLGSKGSYFANKDECFFQEPLKLKSEVIDTTGAGDAFNGALSVALVNNLDYKSSLVFATKVAGISTTRLGAANAMPTEKEIEIY
jgi:ribokinase